MKWEHFFSFLAGTTLLAFLVYLAFFRADSSQRLSPDEIHKMALAPTLSHFQGKTWFNVPEDFSAEQLKGRLLLLVFQSPTMPSYQYFHPVLKELKRIYEDKIEVIWVLSPATQAETSISLQRDYLIMNQVAFPAVFDVDLKIWKSYGVTAWPSLILLDHVGELRASLSGERSIEEISREIDPLLVENRIFPPQKALTLRPEYQISPRHDSTLHYPTQLAWHGDYHGQPLLLIADTGNHQIKGVRMDGQVVFTVGQEKKSGFMDGQAQYARLNFPRGMEVFNDDLYFADSGNHAVRKLDLKRLTVETVLGNGGMNYLPKRSSFVERQSLLSAPWDLTISHQSSTIFIALAGAQEIWSYHLQRKELLNAWAGPQLRRPTAIARYLTQYLVLDGIFNSLQIFSAFNSPDQIVDSNVLKQLSPPAESEDFFVNPQSLTMDSTGVYLADTFRHAIRKVDSITGGITTVIGGTESGDVTGKLAQGRLNAPHGLLKVGSEIWVADTLNHQVKLINLDQSTVKVFGVFPAAEAEMAESQPVKLPATQKHQRLTLQAEQGWIFNVISDDEHTLHPKAPSRVALFKLLPDGKTESLQSFQRKDIANQRLQLPKIEKGVSYLLQGKFYTCEASKRCYVQGHEYTFLGAENGDQQVNLNL